MNTVNRMERYASHIYHAMKGPTRGQGDSSLGHDKQRILRVNIFLCLNSAQYSMCETVRSKVRMTQYTNELVCLDSFSVWEGVIPLSVTKLEFNLASENFLFLRKQISTQFGLARAFFPPKSWLISQIFKSKRSCSSSGMCIFPSDDLQHVLKQILRCWELKHEKNRSLPAASVPVKANRELFLYRETPFKDTIAHSFQNVTFAQIFLSLKHVFLLHSFLNYACYSRF